MSENKEIFNKNHQRLFDSLSYNKKKYVDLVVNNKTNKYGGKNKEDVERAIDEIIDRGYLNKPVNYSENIQDDIVITASICNYIENQMIDKINIVKKVCAELGITQAELGRQLDVPASTIGTWASGKIPKMAEVALTLMIENKEQKEILDAIKKARDFIGRI